MQKLFKLVVAGIFALSICVHADDSTLKEIVVASGSTSVPNSYIVSGKHTGHEVDIWNEISKKTGLKVKFITGEFNTLFGYLDSGKADTVGNTITINQKRLDKYDFSEPYAYIPEKLVVQPEREDIKKLKDIEGLTCGYSAGSNGGNLFEQIAKKQNIKINLVSYDSSELLAEAFRRHKVDVMIFSAGETAFKIKNGYLKARMAEENVTLGLKAYPFVKSNERSKKLREIVTKAIQEMKADGTLTKIYEKWYGMDFSNEPKDAKLIK
ncbi:transporter substrate-binding domain-containing protein [Halarcobacter ebronensis]|uniref:Amino acid ABC transporter substrate-binding protein n=1 Tax=Halarcobacter ebronensis TaxID=1462615 RepID=A0A4Q1AK49_9BACT|nr:transporter substrate-binding domain-containing protein [Halarcobacter ebronensis]QKF81696.1 amino acid ABC transporter, periplasmic amino acid-binding protein [Halarcobacter ebronensis]RXK04624.1 amino acid ABC transporter substrate-binding protein [Halarcobacter ebronensis]